MLDEEDEDLSYLVLSAPGPSNKKVHDVQLKQDTQSSPIYSLSYQDVQHDLRPNHKKFALVHYGVMFQNAFSLSLCVCVCVFFCMS